MAPLTAQEQRFADHLLTEMRRIVHEELAPPVPVVAPAPVVAVPAPVVEAPTAAAAPAPVLEAQVTVVPEPKPKWYETKPKAAKAPKATAKNE